MYYKEVDKRYRESMTAFLKRHFRYNTMNSWNKSTSYANCIKPYNIDKPDDIDSDTPTSSRSALLLLTTRTDRKTRPVLTRTRPVVRYTF